MKITVLSGSPKGELSVSLQYFKYMTKEIKDIDFTVFPIGEQIYKIEKNQSELQKIIDEVKNSDAVLWVFPVYHYLPPYQVKRFIELINENGFSSYFQSKYSTSIISSVHFYDTLAESYIHNISEDFGMKYVSGFLAEMDDLKKPEKQNDIKAFGKRFFEIVKDKKIVPVSFSKNVKSIPSFIPEKIAATEKRNNYKILLITDNSSKQGNMKNMIDIFLKRSSNSIEVINLDELETKGGCLGCCSCGYDGECIYKDEMSEFLHTKFLSADAFIIAAEIKDRYFSSTIKRMYDRSFSHGHRPVLDNKKILYIISGALSDNSILKTEITARCSVSNISLVDIVSDEFLSSSELSLHLEQAGDDLINAIKTNRRSNENFYSIAGHKIFRDFIYLIKFVFRADHEYYKKINYYDFPQKKIGTRIANSLVLMLLKIKPFRAEFKKRIKPSMVHEFQKIVAEVK